jgi:hypothetical protein
VVFVLPFPLLERGVVPFAAPALPHLDSPKGMQFFLKTMLLITQAETFPFFGAK